MRESGHGGNFARGDDFKFDGVLDPPSRIFERLAQIAGYTWDESKEPFILVMIIDAQIGRWRMSGLADSYCWFFGDDNTDEAIFINRQVNGTKHTSTHSRHSNTTSRSDQNFSRPGTRGTSRTRNADSEHGGSDSAILHDDVSDHGSVQSARSSSGIPVIARISSHALREERAFHICQNVIRSVDPDSNHIIKPVDLVRLPSQQDDKGPIVVCIFEHPGYNYLQKMVDYGPACGATECLEILHHGQRLVHGEIRGDAFHMNAETGRVKLINFGSGLRTFEHGLTSTGWSTLTKELGAKTKLTYMSPEQTGRMPAEPDSRTDIYSLGILFWTMLTQQPAFEGETPMDIIQGVLGRRLPSVSSVRLDIPDVISKIIQKMTAKIITERYHSVSGLRHDLVEVRRLLGAGDSTALKNWNIATKDVSSFFILPSIMIGRSDEHDEVVKIIDKVSRRHLTSQRQDMNSLSSGSSLSDGRLDGFDTMAAGSFSSEENTSSAEGRSNSFTANNMLFPTDYRTHRSSSNQYRSAASSQDNSLDDSNRSGIFRGAGSLMSTRNTVKFRRKGRCEVVSIAGAAGLGKSCLVQSVHIEARRRGYFASSKFDSAKKTPFGPVLKLLSSLFKQVFSESDTDTPFHALLKQYVRPAWPLLHKVLGLPEFLIGPMPSTNASGQFSQGYNKSLRAEFKRRDSSPSSQGHIKNNGIGLTRIVLKPLTEDDILEYISATLCRPKSEIVPLSAVIQSKTAGNPFYIREMLDSCHRKQCIWYDYKENVWKYDLDRIFKHFETKSYDEVLNSEFVTSRLNELPPASRSILAWASLIGTTFSFELVQRLMSGEFDPEDHVVDCSPDRYYCLSHTQQDTIGGLQAAIQAYIIVATQDDDRFRFAHDRYIQAASSLRECNGPKMHFIIAQTLMKYYSTDERSQDLHRHSFRKLLFDCATAAAESGARPTAARFYAVCFRLLQKNPWSNDEPDCYYDETLQLYTRAAECCLYMGQYQETKGLLAIIFQNARTPVDKSPAWVLQSRTFSQEGDARSAFEALKQCLAALDIEVDENPSFEKCDNEFKRLSSEIQSIAARLVIDKPMMEDSNLAAVGAVLVETINAAFWTDTLTFYQMSIVMVQTHLKRGSFPQAGMAFLHLATIAITRFNMIQFASDMGNVSLALMDRWRDIYTLGRGGTIYSLFVGHIHWPLSQSLGQLERALEYTIQAGDRMSTILNFGFVGTLKFFASENLADLESFCTYGCEEVPDWQVDSRGGTMLIVLRQVCRALQGKTITTSPTECLNDASHTSLLYKAWLRNSLTNSDRSIMIYEGFEIVPLFLYGHYSAAVTLGEAFLEQIDSLWSIRNTRFTMFFHGLSLAASFWAKKQTSVQAATKSPEGDRDWNPGKALNDTKEKVSYFQKKIEDWQVVSDVNYLAWSKLLAAQVSEMEGDHGGALRHYEEALDHASSHDFMFEEALGNFLLAGFLLRAGSRRPARAALQETIMLYRQFGAGGIARHIEIEHSLLLQGPTRSLRYMETSTQTDFAGDSAPTPYRTLEGDENDERQRAHTNDAETKGDRIGAWQGGSARPDAGSGLPALDMLDLTSILESSQVISSVLQVDELLKTMCEIILQNCGGLASVAAIVVEEEDPIGWSIAASGDPEKGATAHIPGLPLSETALVAEGVILYCTRFRETVFLPDLINDERFSNVNPAWSARNPLGKSVIAIPICHGIKPLLGVLYLEGQPNAFTDRNLTVLQLLVNQIGISYSNALTLKEVEKVSAFNNSMVDVQRRALAKALEAETNANLAKAEALRNVKLAEEAAKAKSIFLANVSHELRTPLNGVIGNSELLRDSDLRKEQAEMADSIRVSADLLLTVINDILDFSKMEADKMKLFIVAFNADEMIREVVRSVSYSNRDKRSSRNVEIIQDINLPQSLIYGDPVRLHQVLGNLIGNSLKFTENGSITVGAKTDWETKDAVKLTFWVKDTGIGIPRQQLLKLFKPFSQADNSTARRYGGSGLGLSICKSLIESMMGGQIELESVENQGTTVWFSVNFNKANPEVSAGDTQYEPRREAIQKPIEVSGVQPDATEFNDFSHISRDKLCICIAEDNPINQKIAIQFMQKLGFKIIDAYDNGMAAVEGIRKKAREGTPYHIVLMDVQMPVLDGYEATKLLRKDPIDAVRGILVIAMTASAIQGDREKCLASGMNDYLAKPVRSGILKKKLDQYLQQTPLSLPNLNADAKKVARDILQGAKADKITNGTRAPSLPSSKDTFIDENERSASSSPANRTPRTNSVESSFSPPPLSRSPSHLSGEATPTPLHPYGTAKNEPHRLSITQMCLDDLDKTPTGEDGGRQLTDGSMGSQRFVL
ncbi:Two-component system protein A 1 [Botrytis cinerea]